ncbi:MAG: tetratricopeptide repeat protein, partial [Burkholderiaceae bacterium]|nr:tetratricopeptide repeat protein [Burkholderiaceae bacterium]
MLEYEYDDEQSEQDRKDLDETLKRFRESVRSGHWQQGSPTPEALEPIVQYCLETNKFDDALTFSRMWVEKAPYASDAWHKLGMSFGSLNRWVEALEAYDKALQLDPCDSDVMVNRAIALEQLGRLDQAHEVVENVL